MDMSAVKKGSHPQGDPGDRISAILPGTDTADQKTSLIGVILPKINSDTISREVTGISDILTRRGYQLILANTNNDVEEELKYLSLFKERQVDGVVFIATMFTRKHKQMLKDYKVPIVILGQHLDGYPCIYQDDHKAAFQVTEKLAEKGKKFAYIGVTDKDEAVGACRKRVLWMLSIKLSWRSCRRG